MKEGAEVGRRVRHATDVCVCAPVWGEECGREEEESDGKEVHYRATV